jgi:hypothetical protein
MDTVLHFLEVSPQEHDTAVLSTENISYDCYVGQIVSCKFQYHSQSRCA